MRCERAQQTDLADFATDREAERYAAFRSHYPTCADCAVEVGRWLRLDRALDALAEAPGGGHPDEASLLAYARSPQELAEEQIAPLSAHLNHCAPCRSEFKVLRGFDFDAIRSPALAQAAEAPLRRRSRVLWEGVEEELGRLAANLSGWLPRPALAAAATALVLLPLGWLALQSLEGPAAPRTPQLAQRTQPAESPALDVPSRIPAAPPSELAEALEAGAGIVIAEVEGSEATSEPVAPPEPSTAPLQIAEIEGSEAMPEPASAPEPPTAPLQIAQQRTPTDSAAPATERVAEPIVLDEPILIAALMTSMPIVYAIDQIGALAGQPVRTFGVVRSASRNSDLELRALAPLHAGWTSQASPTLYWWLSEPTDLPLEFTVADDTSIEPLVEVLLEGPHRAGIHSVSLAETGAKLTPEVRYRWQVALISDPERRSKDVRTAAAVVRHPLDSDDAVKADPAGELAHRYAALGYWYDAFETLTGWLNAEPEAENLRSSRRALLEQVGLDEVRNRRNPGAKTGPAR
ncbi:MAG: DUF928 domain-containing protein [Myxococcales bacterium]|nr:DUF928 domain-containing protein [Myxococcales bacterium]